MLGRLASRIRCLHRKFLWALAVSAGAGALLNAPKFRVILGGISFTMLLILAFGFYIEAKRWKANADRGRNPELCRCASRKKASQSILVTTSAFNANALAYTSGLH